MPLQSPGGKETPSVLFWMVAVWGSEAGVSKPPRPSVELWLCASHEHKEVSAHFSLNDGKSILSLLYPTRSFHKTGWSFVTAARLLFLEIVWWLQVH